MPGAAKYDDVVLDMAKQRIQDETSRARTLRDRAATLIQIDLVLLGVLATVLTANYARAPYNSVQVALFALGILFPLVSALVCFQILVPTKKGVFDIGLFDERHRDDKEPDRMDTLIGTVLKTVDEGKKDTDGRTNDLIRAYYLSAIGIIIIGLVALNLVF